MEPLPKEPSLEEIDAAIEKLLEELDSYVEFYNNGGPELQEEWYWTVMAAKGDEDRQTAKTYLEGFISKLKRLKEKP